MTTVAIIGGGVAGLSLAYVLAKRSNPPQKILVFDSDSFAPACSLRSTAIVAPRGVSAGYSELGDELVAAFTCFKQHIEVDKPQGIFPVKQFSGASTKLEAFKLRYPHGVEKSSIGFLTLKDALYIAEEDAFMVDPAIYLNWLREEAKNVIFINEFVIEVSDDGVVKTQANEWATDKVVFTSGVHNTLLGPARSKKVQGAYFEFSDVDLGSTPISVTLDGDNFIYHAHTKKLLIGSTTDERIHFLPNETKLSEIYRRLASRLTFSLPPLSTGVVRVGLREKAPKRKPYILGEGKFWSIGGFYKNGWSLGLYKARELSQQI